MLSGGVLLSMLRQIGVAPASALEGCSCGRARMGSFVFLAFFFFPVFVVIIVQFEANLRLCGEADCGLVGFSLVLRAFRLFWGLESQVYHWSFRSPRGRFYTPTIRFKKKMSRRENDYIIQNCLQWGRSNLVDPTESPEIR